MLLYSRFRAASRTARSFMSSRRILPALLVGCALLLGAATAPAIAAPQSGIQVTRILPTAEPAYYASQLDRAKRLRVSVVRTELRWSDLEPDRGGERNPAYLASLDTFFRLAKNRRLKVMVTMLSTPCWASSAPPGDRGDCSGADKNADNVTSYPPTRASDFAGAAAFVARRYKAQIRAFEIWNEPDHQNQIYFAGPDKVQRYAAILKESYKAIKQASPRTLVLGGAMVGSNGLFLEALYKAGIKGHYDVLSVHYYDLVLASIRSIRSVQRRNGDRKPLWLGEVGWPNCYPKQKRQGGHACVSSRVQGQSIRDIFAALRRTSYVKGAVVYNLVDSKESDFGLVDERGKLKSAYSALKKVARRAPKPRKVKLKLRRKGGRVIAAGSGPAGDAYELDVFKGGNLRYKLTFRLNRNLRYSFKLPSSLGSRGLKVKVYQYWLGSRKGTTRRT